MTTESNRDSEVRASKWRLNWLCAALIAVIAAWNVFAVIEFDFVWFDDDINILLNPHLGPPGAESLRWMFSDTEYMRRYVPLGWLSFSVVYGVSGLSPTGYHIANLMLHSVNTLLVFALLHAVIGRYRPAISATWQTAAAMVAAGLWALHPMKAETAGWSSGLLYGVSGCFALSGVLIYLHADTTGTARRRVFVLAAALLYGCSVFTYPMSVGMLAVFVLIDVADRPRKVVAVPWRTLLTEKFILAVPGLASAVAAVLAGYGAPDYWPRPPSLAEFGVAERVQQTFEAARYYLWRPWWPVDLTPVPTRLTNLGTEAFVWSGGLMVGITLVLFTRRQWRRGALLLWMAHLAVLAPMLGFTERTYVPADRYYYLPSSVAAAAIALLMTGIGKRFWQRAVTVGAVALAIVFGVLQRQQLEIWRSTDSLLARVVAQATDFGVRQQSYWRWIQYHLNRGQPATAGQVLAAAATRESNPDVLMRARAAMERSEANARASIPRVAVIHHENARAFSRRGRLLEADEHFRAALRIAPQYVPAAFNYAVFLSLRGRGDDAFRLYLKRIASVSHEEIPADARRRLLGFIRAALRTHPDAQRSLGFIDSALARIEQESFSTVQ